MTSMRISYRQLAEVAIAKNRELDLCMAALTDETPGWSDDKRDALRLHLRKNFLPKFACKWKQVNRTRGDFESNFAEWLENEFVVATRVDEEACVEADIEDFHETPKRPRGRGVKRFSECAARTRRRKVREAKEATDPELISQAAHYPTVHAEIALALIMENSMTKATYEDFRRF